MDKLTGEKLMLEIAICDDEIEEAIELKEMVEKFMQENSILYHIYIFTSGEALLNKDECFDIVLLDIAMKEMDGIETGMKMYQKNLKVRIIYITRFYEYCNDAINHAHAFAYLTKPIDKEKLFTQISELVKVFDMNKEQRLELELTNITEVNEENGREYLLLKVFVSDILYYEYVKAGRKIRVKMKDKIYEYTGSMAEVERKMKLYGFGACYRGILVNFEHVIKAKGNTVYLNTGETLPLSPKRGIIFKEQLNEYVHRSV